MKKIYKLHPRRHFCYRCEVGKENQEKQKINPWKHGEYSDCGTKKMPPPVNYVVQEKIINSQSEDLSIFLWKRQRRLGFSSCTCTSTAFVVAILAPIHWVGSQKNCWLHRITLIYLENCYQFISFHSLWGEASAAPFINGSISLKDKFYCNPLQGSWILQNIE